MTHHALREVSKFLSGAVAAKIAMVLWLSANGLMPVVLAGTPFADFDLLPAMVFSVAILALLVYFGWHVKSPVYAPSERKLLLLAGLIFLIVAVVHGARLVFGWTLFVGDLNIPLWLSWLGVVVAAYLSYASFHFALRMRAK